MTDSNKNKKAIADNPHAKVIDLLEHKKASLAADASESRKKRSFDHWKVPRHPERIFKSKKHDPL
jgi:hypothetical protein